MLALTDCSFCWLACCMWSAEDARANDNRCKHGRGTSIQIRVLRMLLFFSQGEFCVKSRQCWGLFEMPYCTITATYCVAVAVPISTRLSNLLNKDTKTVAAVRLGLRKSQRLCKLHLLHPLLPVFCTLWWKRPRFACSLRRTCCIQSFCYFAHLTDAVHPASRSSIFVCAWNKV